MILQDKVTLVEGHNTEDTGTVVPAHLYYTSTAVTADSSTLVAAERARVNVEQLPFTPGGVYWHGIRFELAGPPMPRTRDGRVHHYTIPLQRST